MQRGFNAIRIEKRQTVYKELVPRNSICCLIQSKILHHSQSQLDICLTIYIRTLPPDCIDCASDTKNLNGPLAPANYQALSSNLESSLTRFDIAATNSPHPNCKTTSLTHHIILIATTAIMATTNAPKGLASNLTIATAVSSRSV